jgi:hypothetical protein
MPFATGKATIVSSEDEEDDSLAADELASEDAEDSALMSEEIEESLDSENAEDSVLPVELSEENSEPTLLPVDVSLETAEETELPVIVSASTDPVELSASLPVPVTTDPVSVRSPARRAAPTTATARAATTRILPCVRAKAEFWWGFVCIVLLYQKTENRPMVKVYTGQ